MLQRSLVSFVYALGLGLGSLSRVAADFVQPDSMLGDFYQSWRVGDTIDIAWNAGWTWGKGVQPEVADLFVMWFDHPTMFSQLVLANVSLATSGNYTWEIDVSNDKVAKEPKFVLRFSQHTNPEVFDIDLPRMPSRGFILNQKATTSSADSSSSSLSPSTATSAQSSETSKTSDTSSSSTAASSASETSDAPQTSETAKAEKKSNTATIAAGVLGGLLVVAAVLGGVLFFLRNARKKREAEVDGGDAGLVGSYYKGANMYAYSAQELPDASPSELPGGRYGQSRELNGSTPRDWH